ncbi:MAG: glycine zipper 2TM domain-containing protein [Ignavibacteria bacterium]
MNAPTHTSSSLHPVFWIAGIAVTLFSLVGIASLTGLLPSRGVPADPQAVATAPATSTTAEPAASANASPAAPAETKPEPAPAPHRKAEKKSTRHDTRQAAALPPPAGAGVPPDYAPPSEKASAPACAACGVVADIRQVRHEGQGTGLGAVGGGLVGGALANNVGQGNGRTLATIAGIVGGGLLGNKIEKSQRETVSYQVAVKMEDGTHQLVNYETSPPWRVGDPVKIVNGGLVAR